MAICFDIHSILARYAKENIWALLYPIAWVGSVSDWYRDELPNNLAKAKVPFHIIGANWSVDDSSDKDWPGYGYSTIFGPNGTILAASGLFEGSDIVFAQIPCQNPATKPGTMDYEYYKTKWG